MARFVTDRGVFAPTPPLRIEMKRGGKADSEEKRFTKDSVGGKGEGRERDAAGAHPGRVWLPEKFLRVGSHGAGCLCTGAVDLLFSRCS